MQFGTFGFGESKILIHVQWKMMPYQSEGETSWEEDGIGMAQQYNKVALQQR
ncbi:hypothetical protein ACJX0J_025778 [Zea mays]